MRHILFACWLLLPALSICYAQGDQPFVQNLTNNPEITYQSLYEQTRQALENLNYPVGRAGRSAYRIDEYVVLYEGAETANIAGDFAQLQSLYPGQVSELKSCGCGNSFQIKLWKIDTIGGTERGARGKDKVAQDIGKEDGGVSPNYFLFPNRPASAMANQAFNSLPAGYAPAGHPGAGNKMRIAVLDSGIDPTLEINNIPGQGDLYLWKNPAEPVVNGSPNGNDPFCFTDDVIGWDFVNNDNNPSDDNSHGTHVSGIIAKQLQNNAPGLAYELMPLKVLDQNGVGTTFDAMCAVLYATHHRADIINASWGYYGEPDTLLEKAFLRAQQAGIVTVTSAGNDRVPLNDLEHYPGEFAMRGAERIRSISFTGGLNQNNTLLWPYTNFRTSGQQQDGFLAGPAQNIVSLIPAYMAAAGMTSLATKSGTSMAAPHLTALVAKYRQYRPIDRPRVVNANLRFIIQQEALNRIYQYQGNTYPFFGYDWLDIPALYLQYQANMITN